MRVIPVIFAHKIIMEVLNALIVVNHTFKKITNIHVDFYTVIMFIKREDVWVFDLKYDFQYNQFLLNGE